LWAINPDGTTRWNARIEGQLTSSPTVGGDGTIYVGSLNNLLAINPDGMTNWSFSTGGVIKSRPVIAEDGTLYFGSDDGHLYALAPKRSSP
jgi:outer membrane protein assembly factor BamB